MCRWITKTHALTSKLKKGTWYDFDERVLHCLFDELVNFVENEAGMSMLEDWTRLTQKDYGWKDDDPRCNEPCLQAVYAKETIELYRWWKEVRPKRKDPWDERDGSDSIRLEREQEDEDTEMLIRLVKIRGALWT
jgi:hypothetical protein